MDYRSKTSSIYTDIEAEKFNNNLKIGSWVAYSLLGIVIILFSVICFFAGYGMLQMIFPKTFLSSPAQIEQKPKTITHEGG